MSNNVSFIENLIRVLPQLKPIYDEHLADNDTLLPHVLMGDLTRFVIVEVEKHKRREVLEPILGCLEEGLENGAEEVKELIAASFVENLMGETVTLEQLKPLMGENLKRAVQTICG